ncbi:MAG: hypothetical protein WA913_00545, partial [Pricia sp.]
MLEQKIEGICKCLSRQYLFRYGSATFDFQNTFIRTSRGVFRNKKSYADKMGGNADNGSIKLT